MRRKLTAIDLFAGAGGVTTGFKAAGIRVLAAVDIDSRCRETYAANHPDVTLLGDDVSELSPPSLSDRLKVKAGQVDILTACAPCQTYSTLGRRHRQADDPRYGLVERVADFVEHLLPRMVVMENVPRLVKDIRFERIADRFRARGYGCWFGIVNAADFGVPQRRRRLVLIALLGKRDGEVPTLTKSNPVLAQFISIRTVRETFATLMNLEDDPLHTPRLKYPDVVARRIAAIPADGGSRTSLPGDLQLECHRRLGITGAGNVYGRMRWDDVAPTLTTRCVTPACGRYLHPEDPRAITLREAACLQSFPADYQFRGGTMAIQAQIGNAVPPRLAQVIGTLLVKALGKGQRPQRLERQLTKYRTNPSQPVASWASSPVARNRMLANRVSPTKPEMALRSALHRLGLRYRVGVQPIPTLRRTPDLVFTRMKLAVFFDGCFWHGCSDHRTTRPVSNAEFWQRKIQGNQARDRHTDEAFAEQGWRVLRVWEHEPVLEAAARVADVVRELGTNT